MEGRLYTYRYTVTTRIIPALRRAAMRAILMFSVGSDGQSHKTVSTNHSFFEVKGEPKRYRTEVLPLTRLKPLPLGQAGSHPRRRREGQLYPTLHCHHHKDFCIKTGSDVGHLNVVRLREAAKSQGSVYK